MVWNGRSNFIKSALFAQSYGSELPFKLLLSMVLKRVSWSWAGPGSKSVTTSGQYQTGKVFSVTICIYNIAHSCMGQSGLD